MQVKNFDWFQAFKGDRLHLPQSQNQGIELAQQLLVPIQAQIALLSGRDTANFLALKFYANADAITCERCNQRLTKSGEGHNTTCEIFVRAQEVLLSDQDECKKSLLLAEQERLAAKLDRTARQLAQINARKSH